jgi:hypothetical protein
MTDSCACPKDECDGFLIALPIPGEAFKKAKCGRDPYPTSKCQVCETMFAHKDVISERIYSYAKAKGLSITPKDIDEYRCQLPSDEFESSPREHVLFALNLLEYQFHHATHTGDSNTYISEISHIFIIRFYLFDSIFSILLQPDLSNTNCGSLSIPLP